MMNAGRWGWHVGGGGLLSVVVEWRDISCYIGAVVR